MVQVFEGIIRGVTEDGLWRMQVLFAVCWRSVVHRCSKVPVISYGEVRMIVVWYSFTRCTLGYCNTSYPSIHCLRQFSLHTYDFADGKGREVTSVEAKSSNRNR